LDRPLTAEKVAAHYNSFYEFSSGKCDIWGLAAFEGEPWKVEITGLVRRPQTLDIVNVQQNLSTLRSYWR
jgi:methionine sulfoxide reductase catalytic subunit